MLIPGVRPRPSPESEMSVFLRLCSIVLLGTLAAAGAAEGPPPPPAGWTDGYVLANGIRIHYWRTGGNSKPVMVLAHGSSDDGLCWTNFAKEFTADFDIIMFDARGHGLSDPPMQGDPADAQAEDLAALIRELKLVKPIVMGHSMGSASAAWFAAKYPDVPRAVILEDPGLVRRPGAGPAGAAETTPSSAAPPCWRATTAATRITSPIV
jgi:pimeloyl-ACP methyl ester carboxylesterase